MSESNCPICYDPLQVRGVAPCWDCGADPAEPGHLAAGRHKYAEFLIFDAAIIRYDFCQVDFGSYAPDYFRRTHRVRYEKGMTFVRDVLDPHPTKDKYCPSCGRRLAFLRFLADVRDIDRRPKGARWTYGWDSESLWYPCLTAMIGSLHPSWWVLESHFFWMTDGRLTMRHLDRERFAAYHEGYRSLQNIASTQT